MDTDLAAKWTAIRTARSAMTTALEEARAAKLIGSSLQAALVLPPADTSLLDPAGWAEVAIVSDATPGETLAVTRAAGDKCARCWRVLPEVGTQHAGLCLRCTAVVAGNPAEQAAAE